MNSTSDDTPRIYSSTPDCPFPDYQEFMTFFPSDNSQDNSQNFSSNSNPNSPLFLENQYTLVQVPGVLSHHQTPLDVQTQPPDQEPWTHVDAIGRQTSPSSDDATTNRLPKSRHLSTPTHRPRHSSASGEVSVGDSAYWTGSRMSQHGFDFVTSLPGEPMDQRGQSFSQFPVFNPHQTAGYASSGSPATITPTSYNHNNPPPPLSTSSQQEHQPPQANIELYCRECKWHAKTRSDLKYVVYLTIHIPAALTKSGSTMPVI